MKIKSYLIFCVLLSINFVSAQSSETICSQYKSVVNYYKQKLNNNKIEYIVPFEYYNGFENKFVNNYEFFKNELEKCLKNSNDTIYDYSLQIIPENESKIKTIITPMYRLRTEKFIKQDSIIFFSFYENGYSDDIDFILDGVKVINVSKDLKKVIEKLKYDTITFEIENNLDYFNELKKSNFIKMTNSFHASTTIEEIIAQRNIPLIVNDNILKPYVESENLFSYDDSGSLINKTIEYEYKENDKIYKGKYAIGSDHKTKLKVGLWQEIDNQNNIVSEGNYKIGSNLDCCTGGFCMDFYSYKIGVWKFNTENGNTELNFIEKPYKYRSRCGIVEMKVGIVEGHPYYFYKNNNPFLPVEYQFIIEKQKIIIENTAFIKLVPLNGYVYVENL